MKLKNRKTGEIGSLALNINPNRESYTVLSTENGDTVCGNLVLADYDTLAELNAEWEDYEEPKWLRDYWFIDSCGNIIKQEDDVLGSVRREIGNYFSSREEAEKAVEKLKAWKRLKDKGLEFDYWEYEFSMVDKPAQTIVIKADAVDTDNNDLDLLFGGEE